MVCAAWVMVAWEHHVPGFVHWSGEHQGHVYNCWVEYCLIKMLKQPNFGSFLPLASWPGFVSEESNICHKQLCFAGSSWRLNGLPPTLSVKSISHFSLISNPPRPVLGFPLQAVLPSQGICCFVVKVLRNGVQQWGEGSIVQFLWWPFLSHAGVWCGSAHSYPPLCRTRTRFENSTSPVSTSHHLRGTLSEV